MKDPQKPVIWFVAAGTGGHIFPGLSLANEIRKARPGAQFLFFGTRDRLEAKIIPKAGQPIRFLSASPWKGRNPLMRLFAVFPMLTGFFQVVAMLLRGPRPDLLVSVGGYVSVPTTLACRLFGVPVTILEPNIRAGVANRLLSRFARKAFCSPGSDALKRLACPVEDTGIPVREDLRPVAVREKVTRILVLGGSQGALSLCKASILAARDLELRTKGVELVLQTGERNFEQSLAWVQEFTQDGVVRPVAFIDDVPTALAGADLVIARAGAMTVAELAIAGIPTIFVPFPFAADDHQRVNAKILADAGAAFLVDERDGNLEYMLGERIKELCFDPRAYVLRTGLAANFRGFGRPEAARSISKQALSLAAAER